MKRRKRHMKEGSHQRTCNDSMHDRHRPSAAENGANGRAAPVLEKSSEGIPEAASVIPHRHRRKQAALTKASKPRTRLAEIAGGSMAGCVAICCCCPCGLFNLLILAVLRLPAGLFLRAFRKRSSLREARKRTAIVDSGSGPSSGGSSNTECSTAEDDDVAELAGMRVLMVVEDSWPMRSPSAEMVQMDKEMWSRFCGSGFWRSLSQREGGW
ncbi:hypothetical protein HPP92_018064 [Vanilla planifolia]|uniref:Pollen preferential protein n=1 Tax=Vanilla planifolia TaxID=51239 RepID=A0A835QDD5_VANPL|nr:hypothetical protein HPP92_018064 [Vanilla planifolia]